MSAPRCWFAVVDTCPEAAWAAAEAVDDHGRSFGWLGVWQRPGKPTRDALLADPRAFDPAGPPGWASVVLIGAQVRVVFDDPAVQRARQRLLEYNPFTAVTTLSRDAATFGGSLVAVTDPASPAAVADDPFRVVATPIVVHIGPGLIGASPPLPAPVIERYGGQPWPADRFPTAR
jgi:hypothetical protein